MPNLPEPSGKERYAIKEDTTVIPFRHADSIDDPLTENAREGAWRMLAEASKTEADAFVASFAEEMLPDGRQRIVRHGYREVKLVRIEGPLGKLSHLADDGGVDGSPEKRGFRNHVKTRLAFTS